MTASIESPAQDRSTPAAPGPFAPAVNGLLEASFGQPLSGITVQRGEGEKNRNLNAAAHTIGQQISLGSDIREDPADSKSMEVIAHEVSHALARGGSGQNLLDRRGDPGEHTAYQVGRTFRHYVEAGAKGPAPRLAPAHGGLATIHRFEAGEHADTVDSAAQVLKNSGAPVDDGVAALMSPDKKITLKNGVPVTPGEITAMMGDFYGAFNKDGSLNPAKSFEALNNGDPEEMRALLKRVQAERNNVEKAKAEGGGFHATDSGEFESLTRNRRPKTDADGVTTGYSFLELAQKNDSHFSTKDEKGTNNNMGAYAAFHKMALDAAQGGDKEQARALEACAAHFLTDRFASGHLVDKGKAMDASGRTNGKLRNVVARIIHNEGNSNPATVQNQSGESWTAMGDEHWSDAGNADNRKHSSQAVYSSFDEINQVLNRKQSADEIEKTGYKARGEVPKFDDARQAEAEARARGLSLSEIAKIEAHEAPGAMKGLALRSWGQYIENPISDAWKWSKDKLSSGWNWAKDKGGALWDGAKQTASDLWDWGKENVSNGVDWAKEKASNGVDWAKEKGSQAWNGAKELGSQAWNGAKELGSQAWNGAKDVGQQTWNGAKELGSQTWRGAKELGGQAWEGAKGIASDVKRDAGTLWDGAKETAGNAWSGIQSGAATAKRRASETWEGTKDTAKSAWGWVKSKF